MDEFKYTMPETAYYIVYIGNSSPPYTIKLPEGYTVDMAKLNTVDKKCAPFSKIVCAFELMYKQDGIKKHGK